MPTMGPHKDEATKERAAFGEVDTVEDIGRIPTTEVDNYHGLTLSVVLIYLVRRSSRPKINTHADAHDFGIGPRSCQFRRHDNGRVFGIGKSRLLHLRVGAGC